MPDVDITDDSGTSVRCHPRRKEINCNLRCV